MLVFCYSLVIFFFLICFLEYETISNLLESNFFLNPPSQDYSQSIFTPKYESKICPIIKETEDFNNLPVEASFIQSKKSISSTFCKKKIEKSEKIGIPFEIPIKELNEDSSINDFETQTGNKNNYIRKINS